MKKPIQNIIPQNVVEAFKALREAEKKRYIVINYGGRQYGKTMLVKMLKNTN